MLLRKGNFKIETESLLIAAQNNAVRIHQISKAKIDKTQQNSSCGSCGDWDQSHNKRMLQISAEWVYE